MMFRRMIMAGMMALMLVAPAAAKGTDKGLEVVKSFMVEHGERMLATVKDALPKAKRYHDILKAEKCDGKKAAEKHGKELKTLLEELKQAWIKAHNNYENVEGIVAGIPSLAKYDLIIDAGAPGTEKEDVAPYDLKLPSGKVLQKPGNIFHIILETALWGTDPNKVLVKVDLDGDGKVELGEALPKAEIVLGGWQALVEWTDKMVKDVKAWKPNPDDAFTAVVTMTPTVGDYFEEWKASKYITGEVGMFVAQSRLHDVLGIMRSCKVMYEKGLSPDVSTRNAALDKKIRNAYMELLAFVNDVHLSEKSGVKFKPEQVDKLAKEAQDIADRIVAMLTQAAKELGVKLKI